tara:strand:- start:2056 stop:3420 length:1365 start_codon:yes stop_codon:yes gene_type:complete
MSGFVLAGVKSGVGKTTIATGIMSALTRSGFNVQPFKAGPDYIDPSYHSSVCNNVSRNLDSWMLDESVIVELYNRSASKADISIVEGVMGLFDGHSNLNEYGSTAHVSKLLKLPVVLIADASKVARSVAAEILGFKLFDPEVNIEGVILNGINSERHLEFCKPQIEETTGIPVLGYMPRKPELIQPERHLGLIPTIEGTIANNWIESLVEQIKATIDLDMLLKISQKASLAKSNSQIFPQESLEPSVKIAIAQDRAFNFYYQDSLDLLSAWGAELIPFSPIEDPELPSNIDGIYMGGGFPEVYAEELSSNKSMITSIVGASRKNIPIYAECGGLMYLGRNIISATGTSLPMAGIFQYQSMMKNAQLTLGYRQIESQIQTPILQTNQSTKGHEFHWSYLNKKTTEMEGLYKISNQSNRIEGFNINKTYATYIHIHLASNPKLAQNFINFCENNQR